VLQLHLGIDTRLALGFLDAQPLLALTRQLLFFDALLAVSSSRRACSASSFVLRSASSFA